MNRKTYSSLQELTGYEAGAVLYANGDIWIGNWSSIEGLPRIFAFTTIGLGEDLIGTRCRVPSEAKRAMQLHEQEQGTNISRSGFRAWKVNEAIVVVQEDWN